MQSLATAGNRDAVDCEQSVLLIPVDRSKITGTRPTTALQRHVHSSFDVRFLSDSIIISIALLPRSGSHLQWASSCLWIDGGGSCGAIKSESEEG